MASLIEARDEIRRQRSRITMLEKCIRETSQQTSVPTDGGERDGSQSNIPGSGESTVVSTDGGHDSEREKMLRQFLLISWGGFLAKL